MDILENTKLTALIHHIAKFLKSVIPTYNFKVLDTADRKTRRRRQAMAKCFSFHVKAIRFSMVYKNKILYSADNFRYEWV